MGGRGRVTIDQSELQATQLISLPDLRFNDFPLFLVRIPYPDRMAETRLRMTIRHDREQIPLSRSMLPIIQSTISGYYLQGVRDGCVINKFTVSDHQGCIGKKATSSTVEDG